MPKAALDCMFVEWEVGSPADVEQIVMAVMEAVNTGNCLFARMVPSPQAGYQALFVSCAVQLAENVQDLYDDWTRDGRPSFNRPTTRPQGVRPKLRLVPGIPPRAAG